MNSIKKRKKYYFANKLIKRKSSNTSIHLTGGYCQSKVIDTKSYRDLYRVVRFLYKQHGNIFSISIRS